MYKAANYWIHLFANKSQLLEKEHVQIFFAGTVLGHTLAMSMGKIVAA